MSHPIYLFHTRSLVDRDFSLLVKNSNSAGASCIGSLSTSIQSQPETVAQLNSRIYGKTKGMQYSPGTLVQCTTVLHDIPVKSLNQMTLTRYSHWIMIHPFSLHCSYAFHLQVPHIHHSGMPHNIISRYSFQLPEKQCPLINIIFR